MLADATRLRGYDKAKNWKKLKTWDEFGREIHCDQHKGIRAVG
jgi:hypothetical protein